LKQPLESYIPLDLLYQSVLFHSLTKLISLCDGFGTCLRQPLSGFYIFQEVLSGKFETTIGKFYSAGFIISIITIGNSFWSSFSWIYFPFNVSFPLLIKHIYVHFICIHKY